MKAAQSSKMVAGAKDKVLAQAIVLKRRVALVIDIEWPIKHHQGILAGILSFARQQNWRCELTPFLGYETAQSDTRFDGIIGRITRQAERYAIKHSVPAVNVWVNSPVLSLPRVLPNHVAAGAEAASHIFSRGFRRFGFLGRHADTSSRLLLKGFSDTLQAKRLPITQLFVKETPTTAQAWRILQDQLSRWIKKWTLPIAIFCTSDITARYLVDSCLRAGIRIPHDVAILGAGNMEITCEMSEPRISSIELGFELVGRQAAALLAQMMGGKHSPPATTFVSSSSLVVRTSTDSFAVTDAEVAHALRLIQDRSSKPVRVEDILKVVSLSRRTLERRFREILGCTIYDTITSAYLERAKRLLVNTKEPLKLIASQSGFSSSQQLSKVFHKIESITPIEYRRKHSKDSYSSK